MGNKMRNFVQAGWMALTNGYLLGFFKGNIYTGDTKALCVPGLNCYSCPGALGSCPIGSLQAVLGSRNYKFSFYIVGFLMLVGSLFGRFICGWLCPFGFIQDLCYKIPFGKKSKNLPADKVLRWFKYVVLLVLVILLPSLILDIIGQGSPWFCKWICPSGTLFAGVPLIFANQSLQEELGFLFAWKMFLLIIILLLSIKVYRPFCKYLCPLGAIYGLFNPIAFYKLKIDEVKCIKCGVCSHVCKMDVVVYKNPNSAECIRCGDCKKSCPTGAISSGFREK